MEEPVARVVSEAWFTALGVEPEQLDDDFFESGGDSMAAMKLIAHLESRTGITVPVEVLFVEGTPRALIAASMRAMESDDIS